MTPIARLATRLLTWTIGIVVLCVAEDSWAESIVYDRIDRATVRVLALGSVDVVDVERGGQHYKLAAPIAGHGSGVLLSEDGLIATADHVLSSARAIAVLIPGILGPMPAVVLHRDPLRDVALLRVSGKFDSTANLAPAERTLHVRQTIYAIGYPLDSTRADPQSTQGVVSGMLADGRIQLGISVNPGNSGGPIIDETSLVQGIVVAGSNVKAGASGLGLAIPTSAFRAEFERLRAQPLSPEQAARLGAAEQQQLADLVAMMAQYGVDVILASLDAKNRNRLEIEEQLQSLADASATTTDAKLVAAAFFWNRHVVLKVRDDPAAAGFHSRAVKLIQQSLTAEPSLRETSAFVRLLAAEAKPDIPSTTPARSTLSARSGFYFSVDVGPTYLGGRRTLPDVDQTVLKYAGYGLRGKIALGSYIAQRIRLGGAATYSYGTARFACNYHQISGDACTAASGNRAYDARVEALTLVGDLGIRLEDRLVLGLELGFSQVRGEMALDKPASGLVGRLEVEYVAFDLSQKSHLGFAGFVDSAKMVDVSELVHVDLGVAMRFFYF